LRTPGERGRGARSEERERGQLGGFLDARFEKREGLRGVEASLECNIEASERKKQKGTKGETRRDEGKERKRSSSSSFSFELTNSPGRIPVHSSFTPRGSLNASPQF